MNALVDYGVDSTLIKDIEKKIAHKVEDTINDFLQDNPLIQQALALDKRILTDRGSEYKGKIANHAYALFLAVEGITPTTTQA